MGLKEGQGFESCNFQVDFWALKLFHILMTYRGIYTCIKVAFKTKKLAKEKILIGWSHTTVKRQINFSESGAFSVEWAWPPKDDATPSFCMNSKSPILGLSSDISFITFFLLESG